MPRGTDIVWFSFLLLSIPCRSHAQPSRLSCQPSLAGFNGTLLDIDFDNSTGACICGGPCFQMASNSCELATGGLASNCFILKETTVGRYACSALMPVIPFFTTVPSILFAISAVAAAAPFVILVFLMLPYLVKHKKHHGHGRAARNAVRVTAVSFVVGWLICGVLIVIGLIIRGKSKRDCLAAANG